MKTFAEIFLIESMTFDKATKILGLGGSPSMADIKGSYRKLVLVHHPDKGGDAAKFREIQAAYEYLKSFDIKQLEPKESYADRAKRDVQLANAVKEEMISKFDTEKYIKHFEDITGKKFFFTITKTYPNKDSKYADFATVEGEFHTEDRNTIFPVKLHVSVSDILRGGGSLGGAGQTYQIFVDAFALHKNKKQKLSKRDWSFTNDSGIFTDPNKIFPKAKVSKIVTDKTGRKVKFKKSDMNAFLKKKLGSDSNNEYMFIPVGKNVITGKKALSHMNNKAEFSFVVFRTTFMRQGYWGVYGITQRPSGKKVSTLGKYTSFPETEDTALFFEKAQKAVANETDLKKIEKKITKLKDEYSQSLKESKNTIKNMRKILG